MSKQSELVGEANFINILCFMGSEVKNPMGAGRLSICLGGVGLGL